MGTRPAPIRRAPRWLLFPNRLVPRRRAASFSLNRIMDLSTVSVREIAVVETVPTACGPCIVNRIAACAVVSRSVVGTEALDHRRHKHRCRRSEPAATKPDAEPFAAPRQAALDRPYGAAEETGRLLIGDVFQVTEQDRGPEPLGQSRQLRVKQFPPIRSLTLVKGRRSGSCLGRGHSFVHSAPGVGRPSTKTDAVSHARATSLPASLACEPSELSAPG